jgi:hypothetical protein
MIKILVFEKTPIFHRKLKKIAENCDHNIDPSSAQQQGDRIGRIFDHWPGFPHGNHILGNILEHHGIFYGDL